MSANQAAFQGPFEVTEIDEAGGLRLEGTASGTQGNIAIEARLEDAVPLDPLPQYLVDAEILVAPTGIVSLKNSLNRLKGRIPNQTGLPRTLVRNTIDTGNIPSADEFVFSERIGLAVEEAQELPRDFMFGPADFEPVRVPNASEFTDQLPSVSVNIRLRPRGLGRLTTFNTPSVTVEIPPSAFIEEVNIQPDQLSCSDRFPDIQSNIDRLRQRVRNVTQLEDDLSRLEDVRGEVVSESGRDRLQDISTEDLSGLGQNRLSGLRRRVREAESDPVPGSDNLSDLRRLASRTRSQIQGLGVQGATCQAQFLSDLQPLADQIQTLEDLSNQIEDLKDSLLDSIPRPTDIELLPCSDRTFNGVSGASIQSRIDDIRDTSFGDLDVSGIRDLLGDLDRVESDIQSIPDNIGGGCAEQFQSEVEDVRSRLQERLSDLQEETTLGCGDVPRRIRNAVAGAEEEARSFVSARMVSRTPNRSNRVMTTIQNARSQVQDGVSDDNPCKSQLLGRLSSAQGQLRQAQPEEESFPCEQRFSGLDRRITEYENDVLDIQPPVGVTQFEIFTNRANSIIDDIEDEIPTDDRCRDRFISRVEGALDRVGDVGARTRVVTELTDEQIEARRERIDELRGRLEEIGVSSELIGGQRQFV